MNVVISLVLSLFVIFLSISKSDAQTEPIVKLRDELLSYFPVVSGRVVEVRGDFLVLNRGSKDGIRIGQRVTIFEETAPLIHPVTGQFLGKAEKTLAIAEVSSVEENSSKAIVIDGKIPDNIKPEQMQFRIPKSKIKLLFAQGTTEWAIGEAYHSMLRASERFELIDAPVNQVDLNQLFKDSKGAEILLLLNTTKKNGNLSLAQDVYWVRDRKKLLSSKVELTQAYLRELRAKFASPAVPEGQILLTYRLSRGISRIGVGYVSGKDSIQVLTASDNQIRLYLQEVDLKLLGSFDTPLSGEIIWFDVGDIDSDGLDEVVYTLRSGMRVVSSVLKWKDGKFVELARIDDIFLRLYDGRLIGQAFSPFRGFEGEVFYLRLIGKGFERLENLRFPTSVNIYDFYIFRDVLYKWEENGFLVLYDKSGIPLWSSKEPLGVSGQYERQTGVAELSLGKWSVFSRIKGTELGIIVIEKKPLIEFVNISLLGYRSSKLRLLQWTGVGIQEVDITEEMAGEILDYSVHGDRLYVLVKPPLGVNFRRLLQGENPFETYLHILSFRY